MEKYTIDELKKISKSLMNTENSKYTQEEKMFIANMILQELEQTNCYCDGKVNCPYSVIQEKEEYPRSEVQILCEYLNWIIFSKSDKKIKYFACPFTRIENDINEFLNLQTLEELEDNIKLKEVGKQKIRIF